jgi:hypothetical protein
MGRPEGAGTGEGRRIGGWEGVDDTLVVGRGRRETRGCVGEGEVVRSDDKLVLGGVEVVAGGGGGA